MKASPRAIASTASVTMNGVMFSAVTAKALKAPHRAPSPMPARKEGMTPQPACNARPHTTPVSATTDPVERSMPPVTITKVSPTATMPMRELASRMDSRLAAVRNCGVVSASASTITAKATTTVSSFSASPTTARPRRRGAVSPVPALIRAPRAA